MKETCYAFQILIDDPYSDEKIKGDPHKTIFIARLVSDVN